MGKWIKDNTKREKDQYIKYDVIFVDMMIYHIFEKKWNQLAEETISKMKINKKKRNIVKIQEKDSLRNDKNNETKKNKISWK